jgi:hypothetical protein
MWSETRRHPWPNIIYLFNTSGVSHTRQKVGIHQTGLQVAWRKKDKTGKTTIKHNPNLGRGTNHQTQGEKFSFWKSDYVDDAAFLFTNRQDIEKASTLILYHFNRFGLTVHSGDRTNNEKSKT